MTTKYFTIQTYNGRSTISVDRLKPACLEQAAKQLHPDRQQSNIPQQPESSSSNQSQQSTSRSEPLFTKTDLVSPTEVEDSPFVMVSCWSVDISGSLLFDGVELNDSQGSVKTGESESTNDGTVTEVGARSSVETVDWQRRTSLQPFSHIVVPLTTIFLTNYFPLFSFAHSPFFHFHKFLFFSLSFILTFFSFFIPLLHILIFILFLLSNHSFSYFSSLTFSINICFVFFSLSLLPQQQTSTTRASP
ncbi:unnamed protein product [Acanthosepion pharaonis]|uniref:Uncharacterized protein n=1 Tax=Acanthosepion pharaonis TaxID=158019 RepID=A0A812B3I1_ACAPH|nr:unnamed protein product [Sepia pharaonis]